MKEIPLSNNLVALVDDEDYERVAAFKWTPLKKATGGWYARRNGKSAIYMHRFILNTPPGLKTDHKDGDGLNNTRQNLRVATDLQNGRNKRLSKNNMSGFKGVRYMHDTRKWYARIYDRGRAIGLGAFESKELAARAYDEAAKRLHGDFARLNFP